MISNRFRNASVLRVLIFTSPNAGSGASRDQIPQLEEALRNKGVDVTLVHEVDVLRQLANANQRGAAGETIVVAAGGDGTLSLAASILFLSDQTATSTSIMPMPLGTENLLARHFGQKASAESVMNTIRSGSIAQLDAGSANDHTFLIMATCGFDAEVVRRMHLVRRGHISRFSYFLPIMNAIRTYQFPRLRVTVDHHAPIECGWAMAFNLPRYGGGLKIEPDALADDGLLDIITFQRGSILGGLKYASQIWRGRHLEHAEVTRLRGKDITIEAESNVPFQLDGDYAGALPLKISTVPRAVPVLIPASPSVDAPDGLPLRPESPKIQP